MRALPDELSPVTSEVHGLRSTYHVVCTLSGDDASSFQASPPSFLSKAIKSWGVEPGNEAM